MRLDLIAHKIHHYAPLIASILLSGVDPLVPVAISILTDIFINEENKKHNLADTIIDTDEEVLKSKLCVADEKCRSLMNENNHAR